MKTRLRIFHYSFLLGLALATGTMANAIEVSCRMTSQFLVRGERAILEVGLIGAEPTQFPIIPNVENVEINQTSRIPQTQMRPGRILERVFEYEIASYRTGIHEIPPIEVNAGGLRLKTHPIRFEVFEPGKLQWFDAQAGDLRFRYAAAFRALNTEPYEGESTATEMKLYVPRDLLVDDWGIPSFERDGLTAWRFQPSYTRSQINLLGMPYIGTSYPSILTPTKSGKIGIGPAKIRLMTIQVVMDGFPRRDVFEAKVTIPRLDMQASPLPANAPSGFDNAVGNFTMNVHTDDIEYQEGDPIPIEISISGSGNLDSLEAPRPIETAGWKVYEAAKDPRASEREEFSGTVVFRQFIRPLEIKGSLPSYRFIFFNPAKGIYETLTSESIPLLINPSPASVAPQSVGPPVSVDTPTERMSDILTIITPASLTTPGTGRSLPGWFWHVLAGAMAGILLVRAIWLRVAPRLKRDPDEKIRMAELRKLRKLSRNDDRSFLMGVGHFIERWLGEDHGEELQAILEERDATCFRPDSGTSTKITKQRRASIMRTLRNAVPIILVLLLFLTNFAPAKEIGRSIQEQASEAYNEARFDDAIRIWLDTGSYESLSSDTLYNIGNACYRSGSPGHAALYYRRALLRNPQHMESRQNLRFLERKYGALTIQRPDYQYIISRIPLHIWRGILWIGAWMVVLGLLVFPASRLGEKIRIAAAIGCIIGPMIGTTGALGWHYFPNDSRFAPVERQAVVVNPEAIVYTDASRNSPQVIDAPPGSLCEIIRRSGRWAYISFATKTRGWIPIEMIDSILPKSPPSPPKIRKPKANDSST